MIKVIFCCLLFISSDFPVAFAGGDSYILQLDSFKDVIGNDYVPIKTSTVIATSRIEVTARTPESVKEFGAKGDGVTDDTSAIQAAIDAKAEYVPPGNYLISSTLNLPSGYSLRFSSGAIFKAAVDNLTFFHTTKFTSSLSIRDASLSGNGKTGVTGFSFTALQINSEIYRPSFFAMDIPGAILRVSILL